MALEQLAGPFTVTDADGNLLTPANGVNAFYDDALGLCAYDGTLAGHCIIQLDGRAYRRSEAARANHFVVDLQRPGDYLMIAALFNDKLYLFDKHAGAVGAVVLSSETTNYVAEIQVRTMDRYLSVFGNAVRFKPLDVSAAWVTEAMLTAAGSATPTISRTRIKGVLCLAYADGHIVYYDVIGKQQAAGSANIGANFGAWYSLKHDIFIANISHNICVFANAPRPATLTAPQAETLFMKGKVSRVAVRLVGSNSEGCAGELINWSMTGLGSLAYTQSKTNGAGFAYNYFRAPLSSIGSATINAEARC